MLNIARLCNEIHNPQRAQEMYERAVTAFENIIEKEWQLNRTPFDQFSFYPAYCALCKQFFSGVRYLCQSCYHLPDGYDLCGNCYKTRRSEHFTAHRFLRIPSEGWELRNTEGQVYSVVYSISRGVCEAGHYSNSEFQYGEYVILSSVVIKI